MAIGQAIRDGCLVLFYLKKLVMKKYLLLLFVSALGRTSLAQKTEEQKVDSVIVLVKQYFNEKNSEKLYSLAGEKFKKALSAETFSQICENNLFPIGNFNETALEKFGKEGGKYKATFDNAILSMYISLDSSDKLVAFLFQTYKKESALKTYKVASDNLLLSELDKKVDEVFRPYISNENSVGLSIGILKEGNSFTYNYGETEKGMKQVPTGNTIFEIGSITKTFTSILLADAVLSGKLKLDDPVNKYLPKNIPVLQFNDKPVTLMGLSNHSSGMPRMPEDFNITDAQNPYRTYDSTNLFQTLKKLKLTRGQGDKYEYSNLAVGLLSFILTRVYKKSFEQLIVEKICTPLQMNDTRQFIRKNDSSRFAKGYDENGGPNSQWDFKVLAGAGAIRSTVNDLLKYGAANLHSDDTKLDRALQLTHKPTFTNAQTIVGLGWHLTGKEPHILLLHSGETGGYVSYLAIHPKKKIVLVVLSNTAIAVDDIATQLMNWLSK